MAAVAAHASLLRAVGSAVLVYGETAMMASGAPLDVAMSSRVVMPKEEITAYAARLTEFGRRLKGEYGLTLAYHHHLMMVAETFDEISALFDRTGPEVGLLLDTGHAAAAGFNYVRLIERFAERIVHIHLKDIRASVMVAVRDGDLSFNDAVRRGMFTVPGDGMVDFSPLAAYVRKSGYRGWMVVEAEQDPAAVPPLPAVTAAINHIAKIFSA
ncbi:TIM barrel protein [Rhizobium sp. L51/94]|uniref:TIM barrel protein n=1 Tax=Rhizobium sp. L51/94 TaxID=2819999 RepID=UPI00214B9FF6|nr:TIM barrel protein [Rhizobium sp. L51/94]